MNVHPKSWQAGIADEAWKILICGRDLQRDKEGLLWLANLLGEARDEGAAADLIAKFSGEQIAAAIIRRMRSSAQSVENALATKDRTA